jgi:hypothetical protein
MRYNDIKIILEYDRSRTVQRFGDKISARAKSEPTLRGINPDSVIDTVMQEIEQSDPTANKQYVVWMATQYIKGQLKFEDIYKLKADLTQFSDPKFRSEMKRRNITADINQYTPRGLADLVTKLSSTDIAQPDDTDTAVEGAKVLYDGPLGKLVIPETEAASCALGSGTRWCTAADKNNMFNTYSSQGPLYIWFERKNKSIGKKFQFHFESGQFMDAQDSPISGEILDYFANQNPVTAKLFKQKNPQMYELVQDWADYQEREPDDDGDRPYDDALEDLEVENFIPMLTDEQLLALLKKYRYVTDLRKMVLRVIDSSRPALSMELSTKSPASAYDYAKRNPGKVSDEHIKLIASDPKTAYFYAQYELKGPFPEGEAAIATEPSYSFYYADKVLNGRFPAGEPAMKTRPETWNQYQKYIAKSGS